MPTGQFCVDNPSLWLCSLWVYIVSNWQLKPKLTKRKSKMFSQVFSHIRFWNLVWTQYIYIIRVCVCEMNEIIFNGHWFRLHLMSYPCDHSLVSPIFKGWEKYDMPTVWVDKCWQQDSSKHCALWQSHCVIAGLITETSVVAPMMPPAFCDLECKSSYFCPPYSLRKFLPFWP